MNLSVPVDVTAPSVDASVVFDQVFNMLKGIFPLFAVMIAIPLGFSLLIKIVSVWKEVAGYDDSYSYRPSRSERKAAAAAAAKLIKEKEQPKEVIQKSRTGDGYVFNGYDGDQIKITWADIYPDLQPLEIKELQELKDFGHSRPGSDDNFGEE